MQMDFWQLSRNSTYVSIPGKLSEIHLYLLLLSNPGEKVLKSIQSRWQICPIILRRKRTFPHGLEYNHAWNWISSRNADIYIIPRKLSEVHFPDCFVSNLQGKVCIIVGISCSPDQRVKHIHKYLPSTQYVSEHPSVFVCPYQIILPSDLYFIRAAVAFTFFVHSTAILHYTFWLLLLYALLKCTYVIFHT